MRLLQSYSWRLLNNERGMALFAAAMAMVLMSVTLAGFMTVGRDEALIAQNDLEAVQARIAADAGGNLGRFMLAQRVRVNLPVSVASTARATMVNNLNGIYNSAAGAAQLIIDLAQAAGGPNFVICPAGTCPEPTFVAAQIPDAQQAVLTLNNINPPYTARVIVSATGAPVLGNGGQSALLTYSWRVQSTGTSGRTSQPVIQDSVSAGTPVGTFTVALQAGFVQFAHFINSMDNTDPWVSYRHVYTGPVHTNERFNILGNPGGPTFRSEATQTFNTTRFNNGGSATTVSQDSTANDQPLLGQSPGTPCQVVDCTGFTRNFDFNPATTGVCPGPGCDPIPVPAGAGDPDRANMVQQALGLTPPDLTCVRIPACAVPVFVANVNNATGVSGNWISAAGTLNGGIFVQGNVLDLQLGAYTGQTIQNGAAPIVSNGQVIIIQTPNVGGGGGIPRRTVIAENNLAGPPITTVVRQCWGPPAGGCGGGGANQWNPDTLQFPGGPGNPQNTQVLNGLLSPNNTINNGVLFVTGNIGVADTGQGMRRGVNPAAINWAIDQNTRLSIGAGGRNAPLPPAFGGGTVGAGAAGACSGQACVGDGNIYLTGHVNYRIDPRGANGVFEPTPGTGDDNIDVQNVLGVVSWDGGIYISRGFSPAPDPADAILHGMFMAPNLTGAPPQNPTYFGEGQFSYGRNTEGAASNGACDEAYRGRALLLGGVVQMRMGCLGTPGSPGLGYARTWTYDERFRVRALSPPVFPGFPNFTTNVSLGIDSFGWRAGRY